MYTRQRAADELDKRVHRFQISADRAPAGTQKDPSFFDVITILAAYTSNIFGSTWAP